MCANSPHTEKGLTAYRRINGLCDSRMSESIYFYLMLLWSYRVESRVGFSGVGRGLVEHVNVKDQ
jgi:hypothetical protein